MAMVVKNNMSAISTLNTLNRNSAALSKSLQKVSSGMKINGAADDASGYAISERMRVQIRSLDQANQNTQNGNSMMKTAEGAVASTVEILKTLKEKVINAANDTNTDSDRATIQKELNQSIDQIDDNANITYNGKYLVDGSKNTLGQATNTSMTNQSLNKNTTAATKLTDLQARNGDNLEISTTDKVTVSYVRAGNTYSTTFSVSSDTDLQDIFVNAEGINEEDQIFADKANTSYIKASLGNTDVTTASFQKAVSAAIGSVTKVVSSYKKTASAMKAHAKSAAGAVSKWNAGISANAAVSKKAIGKIGVNASDYDLKNAQSADAYLKALMSDKAGLAVASVHKIASNGMVSFKNATASYKKAGAPVLLEAENVGVAASNDMVKTADGTNAITVMANESGIYNQISGLNISVRDSEGNVKKSVNAALDGFTESVRAQNKSDDNAITLQVGAKANQSIKVGLTDMRSEALGLKGSDGTKLNISTQVKANAAVNVLDNALQKALDQQTTIGSIQSRLDYTSSNLTTASENVQASESAIRDADMAKEMTNYTKNNVLLQAAQSMLSQANQNSSAVLSLLQ